MFQILAETVWFFLCVCIQDKKKNSSHNFFGMIIGVDTARASSPVRWRRDVASPVTEGGMGHGVTSSVPKGSLGKTAKRCVPPVKMVITVTPFMASALTVTLAGLGTGKRIHASKKTFRCCCLVRALFSCRALSFQSLKKHNGGTFN